MGQSASSSSGGGGVGRRRSSAAGGGRRGGGEDIEIDLRNFNLLRCVGKGAFGKVRIVEKRDSRKLYALKYINKMQCIRMRAIQNIFRERAILEEIQHPNVVNLRYAFQDDTNLFIVLDLMIGGDLRYHLDRLAGFREDAVRVFAAEITSALEYLHARKIVHRDLKPDNILFDDAGHVHLTDFNIAVKYGGRSALKSHSGTLAYMAPEIFGDSGYLWQVDWWSLGVCLFECIYGKRPFRGTSNEALTQAICNQPLVFPAVNQMTNQEVRISPECRSFIAGLLERNIDMRLGCGPTGSEAIRNHPWMRKVSWKAVETKTLQPIFIPEANRSNFDASYDLEELLLEDNPLTYRPRKRKPPRVQMESPGAATSRHLFSARKQPMSAIGAVTPPSTPQFDPRNFGRNRGTAAGAAGGGGGGIGLLNKGAASIGPIPQQAAVGGSAAGGVDRTTAELQFIDENFRPFDYTLIAMQKKAAADIAALASLEAAANGVSPGLGPGAGLKPGSADAAVVPGSTIPTTVVISDRIFTNPANTRLPTMPSSPAKASTGNTIGSSSKGSTTRSAFPTGSKAAAMAATGALNMPPHAPSS